MLQHSSYFYLFVLAFDASLSSPQAISIAQISRSLVHFMIIARKLVLSGLSANFLSCQKVKIKMPSRK